MNLGRIAVVIESEEVLERIRVFRDNSEITLIAEPLKLEQNQK